MERYLPDSVQYCSLARVHKITKYFNMVEASQKGFVTHVVMCDRRGVVAKEGLWMVMPYSRKLSDLPVEEQTLIQFILDLDSR
jgi:hypothetical protein